MAPRRKPREEARKARNEVYREHIVEAAERVFADRGFETAKVQEISQLAGLSMGTIYAIFPGKTELYTAVLEERAQELLALARTLAVRRDAPLETLHALVAVYVDYFVGHPYFLRMHLRSGASWALVPAGGPDTRAEHWSDILSLQADIFRRGVTQGVFVDEDPAFLSRMFSAMDQVLLAEWVAGGMKAPREELVRRLGDMVERAFCRQAVRGRVAVRR